MNHEAYLDNRCLLIVLLYQLYFLTHGITVIWFPKPAILVSFLAAYFSQNHPIPLSPALGCGSCLPHKVHFLQLPSCHSLQMPLMGTFPSAHSHCPEIFFFKKPMSGTCSFIHSNENTPSPSPRARHNGSVLRSQLSHLALHAFCGRKP